MVVGDMIRRVPVDERLPKLCLTPKIFKLEFLIQERAIIFN
jgi:hypothetical protein